MDYVLNNFKWGLETFICTSLFWNYICVYLVHFFIREILFYTEIIMKKKIRALAYFVRIL
jgi:hypothetical protein